MINVVGTWREHNHNHLGLRSYTVFENHQKCIIVRIQQRSVNTEYKKLAELLW